MAVKTQGTNLFALDPSGNVIEVGCVTSISGIDETLEQIETTCLSAHAREYVAGLSTPGTANFTVQFDPENEDYIDLYNLKKAGTVLGWAVGFRQESKLDNPDVPTSTTDSSGDFVFDLSSDRSWIVFEGFMNSWPFDFEPNAVVESNVGIQLSGEIDVIPRSSSS